MIGPQLCFGLHWSRQNGTREHGRLTAHGRLPRLCDPGRMTCLLLSQQLFVADGASPNLPQRHFAIKRPHFDTVEGFRRRRPPLTTFDSSMRRPFAHGHQHATPVRPCAGVRRFLGLPSSFSALPSPIRRAVPNLRPSEPDAKLGTLKTR